MIPQEEMVIQEHDRLVGKILLASTLTGYVGDTDDQIEKHFNVPIRVKLEPMKPEDGLIHYTDNQWIDPYWDVEIIDKDHPELPAGGLRSCWLFGHSVNVKTGERTMSSDWTLKIEPEDDR